MTKKDTPSRRLAEAIEYENWLRRGVPLLDLGKVGPATPWALMNRRHRLNLDDPENRAALAMFALQIGDKDKDEFTVLLRKVFDAFSLDHREPLDWRQLLLYFADAHFVTRYNVGRPKKYDDWRLIEDYATFKEKHPDQSDTAIIGYMTKRGACQGRYAGFKSEKAKKALKKQFDRVIECYAKEAIARSLPKAQAEAERSGKPWTRKAEAEARKRIRAAVKSGTCEAVMWHLTRQPGDKSRP
jgi:hypothetical protein